MGVAPFRSSATCVLALVCALFVSVPALAAGTDAGSVNFVQDAGPEFDSFTLHSSARTSAFLDSHYARMKTFTPYFDGRTSQFGRAWAYFDLYGIEPGSAVARRHPGWILRTRGGRRLHVPHSCSRYHCTLAGDITNPAFRRWWIRRARKTLSHGYYGLYLDNVNMIRRVALADGREVTPYSRRSRRSISRPAWRRHVARYTSQIRRAIPRTEIVHNVIWYARKERDRWSQMQLRAADVVGLERGVNDSGLTGDNGRWGLTTFLGYVDWIHSQGRTVLFDEEAPSSASREYGLAGYLLINEGGDFLSSLPYSRPDNWWPGYGVKLGAPLGRRYDWQGLVRRDFERGAVIVNKPGQARRTVNVGGPWLTADGRPQGASLTLEPASGTVLVR